MGAISQTNIDYSDVEGAAAALANNHATIRDFGWSGRPEEAEQCCLVYTHHRDSGLLNRSNSHVMRTRLSPFFGSIDDGDDIECQSHSHWAVGWIDGLVIRVYRDGVITEAFKEYCSLKEALDQYPVLDDSHYSELEYEASVQSIREQGKGMVKDDSPANWPYEVYGWLSNSEKWQRELENVNDDGAYPSEESIEAALTDMGWYDGND